MILSKHSKFFAGLQIMMAGIDAHPSVKGTKRD